MNIKITNQIELKQFLQSLPPCKKNHERVFRGQNKDYKKLLPSGLRSVHRQIKLWHTHSMLISKYLKSRFPPEQNSSEFEDYNVWIRAMAQHYGPGSEFLDVTQDTNIAIWFALNHFESQPYKKVFGEFGSADYDILYEDRMGQYLKTKAKGVLYILDVPLWTQEESPIHGELVNLMKGPAVFSNSTRIQAQKALLIMAERDLSEYQACEPISICAEYKADGFAEMTTFSLFPRVCDDEWYKTLLNIPLIPYLESEKTAIQLKQPIQVTKYFGANLEDSKTELVAFQESLLCMSPILFAASLNQKYKLREIKKVFLLGDATKIMIESPLLNLELPFEASTFNQKLLWENIANMKSIKANNGTRVDLTNLFVEFSVLEKVWIGDQKNNELLRGVWMTRENKIYTFNFFIQEGKQDDSVPLQPIIVTYRSDIEKFCFVDDFGNWRPLIEGIKNFKVIYCIFSLLEHLSPDLKVNSRSNSTVGYIKTDQNQNQWAYLLRVSKELAQLELLFQNPAYFKVVQKNSDEYYIGSREMANKLGDSSYIYLDIPFSFGEIDLEIVKTTFEQCIQKELIKKVGEIMVRIE